ncbi:hypothetical protein HBI71_219100 [Parastagonospora nodorum]|nr:hypothetical protein HBI71_219100 [Parastagonospora nodorum]KAH5527154.1 hypothetical protein HBI27_237310 [Parastagonospora nodorum]KAH6026250.1 hypothetical protein HBI54_243080 [Parastagonospora nodorum]KAH6191396.1 hypothetical protein HBI53_225090 [Parastagonospora nodorum]KAH6518579.1 hypothetical protein HBI07_237950 [Parastagonospora nodorum]
MDPRLWIASLHDNDDVPSLDIDLAAQNDPEGSCWTDAYRKEANMFTPRSDPQFQYKADQVDMGVAHGNPLELSQSIEAGVQQQYSSDMEVPMTPPPSNLPPGNTPRTPPTPMCDAVALYGFPASSQLFQNYETAYTNPLSTLSQGGAAFALPPAPMNPARGLDQRILSSPCPIDDDTPFDLYGKRVVSHLLSNHEAVFTDTFLDFLRMDGIDVQTHAALTGILATKGFKLSSISQSNRKRIPPPDDMTTPKRKKLSSSSWWGQFLKIGPDSHQLQICDEGQALLDDPFALLGDMYGNKAEPLVTSDSVVESGAYGKLFLYTMALNSYEFRTDVMQIVMRLFYYIVSHNGINHYINSSNCRLQRLFPADIDKLHRQLESFLPPDCTTLKGFKEKLQDLRSKGSSYAFMAKKLGLGSLIMLRDLIPPNKMWACTKGTEKSGISDLAFAHLHSIGVPAQAATIGADKVMHTLLWDLCSTAPGFRERRKLLGEWEPFPGFEYAQSDVMERGMGEVAKHGVGEEVDVTTTIAEEMGQGD